MNDKAKFLEINNEQAFRIECVREMFSSMYDYIDNSCKSSRETSLAITKLEEAQFWLIKSISREEQKNSEN